MRIPQIIQESHKSEKRFNGKFIIDNTLGRDVKFTLEMLQTNYDHATIQWVHSNGTIIESDFASDQLTYIKKFPNLEVNYLDTYT